MDSITDTSDPYSEVYDLAIIGGGPVGLAAGLAAKRANLSYVILEKQRPVNSIYEFPTFMNFFTTASLLEIGGHSFPSTLQKPDRRMTLDYYHRIIQNEQLHLLQYHAVDEIKGKELNFELLGSKIVHHVSSPFKVSAKRVIIATGYFDNPRGLGGVPGEDGSISSYRYTDPYGFFGKDVVVVGAGNGGAEATLELWRHGANVTLVHKYEKPKPTLKYWVGPDLMNRIKEGSIKTVMPADVLEITNSSIVVRYKGKKIEIPTDFVFILTGYIPNIELLNKWQIQTDPQSLAAHLSPNFESSRKGVYVIGSAGAGLATNSIFIENGREDAVKVIEHIKSETSDTP